MTIGTQWYGASGNTAPGATTALENTGDKHDKRIRFRLMASAGRHIGNAATPMQPLSVGTQPTSRQRSQSDNGNIAARSERCPAVTSGIAQAR